MQLKLCPRGSGKDVNVGEGKLSCPSQQPQERLRHWSRSRLPAWSLGSALVAICFRLPGQQGEVGYGEGNPAGRWSSSPSAHHCCNHDLY